MSREFGQYNSGYFHTQMMYAKEDCLSGDDELTRLWGKFFEAFEDVAYAIATSEAGDSSKAFPIRINIEQMQHINDTLVSIKDYLDPFKEVMDRAVADSLVK